MQIPATLIRPPRGRDTLTMDSKARRHPWLENKAAHDSAAGASDAVPVDQAAQLWMVHGQWYDLKQFVSRHPGGSFWISETVGMDITELYETHHLHMAKVDAVLKPYLVGPAHSQYRTFFDYPENGLYPTLKRRVATALKGQANGSSDATVAFKVQCAAILLAHIVCFTVLCRSGGSIVWATLTGITMSALHGIGHNFMHQADNPWMRVCTVGGWNIHLNRVSHAISHHPMPNTEWDLEILGHEPWMFNMVDRPANSKWILVYGPMLCAFGHLLDVILTWRRVVLGKQMFAFEMLSNPLQLVLLCSLGNGIRVGLGMFALMFFVFGAIDSYAGYPLHHTEAAWTVGDASHPRKRDLAEHIVASTVDYDIGAMGSWQAILCCTTLRLHIIIQLVHTTAILSTALGISSQTHNAAATICSCANGLNFVPAADELMPNHCLHHCFPTVDCSKFSIVRPIFEATLKEFGVRQKVIAQPHIYFGMWPGTPSCFLVYLSLVWLSMHVVWSLWASVAAKYSVGATGGKMGIA